MANTLRPTIAIVRHNWNPMQWNHFCLSYDSRQKLIRIVVNGNQSVFEKIDKDLPDGFPRPDFWKLLWIGKGSQMFGHANSLMGEVTDFNGWAKALDISDMQAWTTCQRMEKGDLVTASYYDSVYSQILCSRYLGVSLNLSRLICKKKVLPSLKFVSQ